MFPFDAGRQRFDQSHESLELFEIEEGSETEAPKDGKRFDSEEVRVHNLTYLSEHLEGSHLIWSATRCFFKTLILKKTHHYTRLFGFDSLHQRYDFLLNGKFVEHLTATELRRVTRDRDTIETIANRFLISSTAAQCVEGFETADLDTKRVCVGKDTSDNREKLVLDRTVVESRKNGR